MIAQGLRPASTPTARTVWINEDNAHFYDCHPLEDMSVAGLEALVDTYATGTRVAGILFCVNVQRALFDSKVWEPLYHGYDPETGAEQDGFRHLPAAARELTPDQRGRYWVHALWLLRERGIDHLQVWLDRCRQHGVAGWLSMRMNDCHHNGDEEAFWHPTLWRTRPDLRRAPWRNEGWFEGAYDYEQPAVAAHHLALLRELCERYDMDGIELDWVRWVRHFRPGHEAEGAACLTEFMQAARRLTEQASTRLGHPVRLGVRLPADLTACLDLGYDVYAWAAHGLVDQITLASFLEQCFFDWPVRQWRAVFGQDVAILCQPDSAMRAFPAAGSAGRVLDYALLFGAAASIHQRKADGIYLFNECYREREHNEMIRDAFPGILQPLCTDLGDAQALLDMPRRQAVSYAQIVGPGRHSGSVLPIPLARPPGSSDFGRLGSFISLRIPLGGRPRLSRIHLEISFDEETPDLGKYDILLWINSEVIGPSAFCAPACAVVRPRIAAQTLSWRVPIDQLLDDLNIIEVALPETPGQLVWAELVIVPETPVNEETL